MTFTLSTATLEDIPGVVDVWLAANSDSKNVQAYLSTPAARKYLIECYNRCIDEDQEVLLVMTEEADEEKRRVGAFAKVSFEKGGQPPRHWSARWRAEPPEGMLTEFLEPFWAPLTRQRAAVMGERAHMFLEVMATHPDCQKRGLASTVLKWACERADREGMEFYLDASSKGRPLYEKFGFVVEMEKMDLKAISYPMQRTPGVK